MVSHARFVDCLQPLVSCGVRACSLGTTSGAFAIQRPSLNFLCTQKRKKRKILDPKWWYFGIACVLQPNKKASKVFTILSRGFAFEVGVEFYLGVDSSCFSVLSVLLGNEH